MQDYNQNPGSAQQPNPVIGTPEQDTGTWDGLQSYPDTCAIRSQEFILEQFTGQEVDEAGLVQEAQSMGWYAPGQGTAPEDMGNLLELHGVPVNHYENANTFQLANELAQGHKVMVSVDSGELWGQHPIMERISDLGGPIGGDHAVVVSGIDTTDPDNPQVIISDPGTGEPAATYPMDQFVGTWEDANFQMVATQNPAPSSVPGMENFDYAVGHVPTVAGMPYEEFLAYEDDPAAFDGVLDPTDAAGFMQQTGWEDEPDPWTYEPHLVEQTDWDVSGDTGPASPEEAGGWSGDGDNFSGYTGPDPIDPSEDTDEVLRDVDALLDDSQAMLDDLQDGHLDTYGH